MTAFRRIGPSHYRSVGYDVWRSRERIYRNLFRKDGTASPSYHTETYWSIRIHADGKVVKGFGTKRQAAASGKEYAQMRIAR